VNAVNLLLDRTAPAAMRGSLLVVAHLTALAISIVLGPDFGPKRLWFGSFMGLSTGQVSLVTLWVVFGGGMFVARLGVLLAAVAAVAWSAGYMERGSAGQFWLWFGLFSTVGLVTSGPFIALRLRGARVARPVSNPATSAPESLHFSIRDLGLWMVCAALGLSVFRWLSQLTPVDRSWGRGEVWLTVVVGGTLAVVGLLAAWAALGTRFAPLRIAACCLVVGLAGPWMGYLTHRDGDFFVAPAVVEGVVVLVSLLAVRAAGYRLVQPVPTEA
jgi:hypothetical protein